MITGIIAAIGTLLSLAFAAWRWFARMKRNERRMVKEGKEKVEKANSPDGSNSDLLDGFGKLRH